MLCWFSLDWWLFGDTVVIWIMLLFWYSLYVNTVSLCIPGMYIWLTSKYYSWETNHHHGCVNVSVVVVVLDIAGFVNIIPLPIGYLWWLHDMERPLCEGNIPMIDELITQRTSNAEIWYIICCKPNKLCKNSRVAHDWDAMALLYLCNRRINPSLFCFTVSF